MEKKEIDDVSTLKLSDAFEKTDNSGNFEWGMSLTEFDEEEFIRNRHEKGRAEAKLETAKNLLVLNLLTLEQIAQATGLSLEQVKTLK